MMPLRKFSEWLGFKESIKAPEGVHATFHLKYDDLLVGTLSVRDGVWSFEHSEEFRQSDALRPIVELPNVHEKYTSKELWQFFASRIPSPEQSEVDAILKREHIEENDAVSLLKRFGRRTVANPFLLEVVA
jgi:HipA-like protein